METTKKAVTPRPATIDVTFTNVDFTVNPTNNSVTFTMPAVVIPKYNGPVISSDLCDWSMEQDIPESVFGDAYNAAKKALFSAINTGLVMQALKQHIEIN
jgi:hypothetical protein